MDEKQAGAAAGGIYQRSLKDAMRSIRMQEAERTGVVVALRDAEMARLDLLRERLQPVFAQVPAGVDLFDTGLTPGDPPRLWIDMVSFVEMARDKRTYRFLQDNRLGRSVIMECDHPEQVADAVTAYMAQRLVERERMIARPSAPASPAETIQPSTMDNARAAARAAAAEPAMPRAASLVAGPAGAEIAPPPVTPAPPNAAPPRRGTVRFSWVAAVLIFILGAGAGAVGMVAFALLTGR